MDAARPASRLTCPACGTLQESPGSTVCEQCGADLLRHERAVPFPSPTLEQAAPVRRAGEAVTASLRAVAEVPVRLVRGLFGALAALLSLTIRIVSITLRTLLILLIVGALFVGLSYLPAVQAKVPAANQLPAMTLDLLRDGTGLGGRWLRSLRNDTPPRLEASRSAAAPQTPSVARRATAQKPAGAKSTAAVVPSLTVRSTPRGATVLLNQRRVGRTPVTITVAPGTYTVTVSRSGYASVTRKVTVRANAPASVDVTLAMAP